MNNRSIILLLFGQMLIASFAIADTHYVSTGGSDSGDCTVSACLTLDYVFGQADSGDNIELADGTYTGSSNVIDDDVPNGAAISTGIPGAGVGCTTIQAENSHGASLDGENARAMLNLSNRSNIHIKGIRFIRQLNGCSIHGEDDPGTDACEYITIDTCGFHTYATNQYAIGLRVTGTGGSNYDNQPTYILLVDSWFWGDPRYMAYFHRSDNCTARRCVFRIDAGSGAQDDPVAGFAVYAATNSIIENCISLDHESPCWNGGNCAPDGAGFYVTSNNHGPVTNTNLYGNIAVNTNSFNFQADPQVTTGGDEMRHNVFYGKTASIGSYNMYVSANWDVDISNITAGKNYYNTNDTSGGMDANGNTIDHSLIFDVYTNGINRAASDSNNNNVYNAEQSCGTCDAYNFSATDPGIESDPGILYLLDPSEGVPIPPVDSDGSGDSAQIGATVLKRYEDGNLTSVNLWPFPNEDWIKSDFLLYSSGNTDPDRGFCSNATQLDGVTEITLTSYIWEQLGNQIPADIYGDGNITCYNDDDNDTYQDESGLSESVPTTCSSGYYESGHFAGEGPAADDCDDTDAAINPGATDSTCDGIDQDCSDSDNCGTGSSVAAGSTSSISSGSTLTWGTGN